MKKYLKIVVVSLLVMIFSLQSAATGADASSFDTRMGRDLSTLQREFLDDVSGLDCITIVRETINVYRDDPMFALHYKKDPKDAINMVSDVITSFLSSLNEVSTRVYDPNTGNAYVTGVPTYAQQYRNTCGAASALQVITSLGGSISGSTMQAKENTLISETACAPKSISTGAVVPGINPSGTNDSVLVYEVRNLINAHTSSSVKYAYFEMTSCAFSSFMEKLNSSFTLNGPVVFHAIPKYITSYYPSTATTGHYITSIGYETSTGDMGVNDCHYRSQYNGVHSTTLTQMYNSVHSVSGRYIIYRVQ